MPEEVMVEVEAVIDNEGHGEVWAGGRGRAWKLQCTSVASSASIFRLLEMALDIANMRC
jgi:hypothetical protein